MCLEISVANIDDAIECAELIYASALETCKHRVPKPEDLFVEIMSQFNSESYWHCICRENGVIVGVAGLMFIPYKWDKTHKRAIETAFHANPKLIQVKKGRICLELLKTMENECKARGVKTLTIGTIPELNGMGEWLVRKGFNISEVHYIKEYIS